MPFFSKSITNLEFADLKELLEERVAENVRLEFKSLPPSALDMQKKLTGLGNAFGGYLIVGAGAEGKTGRITELRGVPEQPGYRQQVSGWCFDLVSPPLSVEISDPIPVPGSTKYCYVIYVPESSVTPHFIEGRGGAWIRVGEYNKGYESRLATDGEIRHLFDRRHLVEERRADQIKRSRGRFTQFASAHEKPYLELSVGPTYPSRQVSSPTELAKAFSACRIDWRKRSFPNHAARQISQHESMLSLDEEETSLMIEATVWGMCFYAANLWRPPSPTVKTPKSVNVYKLVGLLLVFLHHAREMLSTWPNPGSLTIEVALAGVRGVEWSVEYRGVGLLAPSSLLDDDFAFSERTTIQDLSEKPEEIALGLLSRILFAMDWIDKGDGLNEVDRLLVAGYDYNYWPVPGTYKGRRS